ncbi:trihelix transcription factor GTL2 [Vigna radiata var. radiata]|uniref:Trihelix transcription factor GTL2 n=1 Tax=Vigna radiata var. radiata TaxID=3916 RepID=A0A1S3V9N5_VIGRR|nr:trihelix transcription factor GTL2 [Vigna radiata var. radiata]
MFDGVPEQFHQFITPRTSLPLHLPFPLHASANPNTTFPSNFDPYNPHHHQLPLQPTTLLHPLHHPPHPTHKDEQHKEQNTAVALPMNFQIQRDQRHLIHPWTNDEVLSLLRIRSSMESWFPELTWEHVSRKLAELGYKRSAEKCKEKFEEESRYFNNNINYGKNNNNYRFLSELEQLYHQGGADHLATQEKTHQLHKQDKMDHHPLEEGDSGKLDPPLTKQNHDAAAVEKNQGRKRKRPGRFEMFKGFCESIVHKMMAQQEEMHNKLLEDMMKRDEEKFTREEAWKKQEMEKMNKELEMMAREQAIAGDRQTNIIQILNKFSVTPASNKSLKVVTNGSNLKSHISQNPNPSQNIPATPATENPTSSVAQDTLQLITNPSTSSSSAQVPQPNPSSSSLNSQNNINPIERNSVLNKSLSSNVGEKDDVGRRWPKDEVLALINLRCSSVSNNSSSNEEKEGNKVPLWERISQGMSELGYRRSAKRCKEKWENINKYFRKTKDVNKKRSLDSRTCPYFHQLSSLYNEGKLVLQSERPESHTDNQAENLEQVQADQTRAESSSQVGSGGFSVQQQVDHGGEKTLMQVPSLDFDQF